MGGAERVALDLAAVQLRLGHRVLAISLESGQEGPLAALFRERNIEVWPLPKRAGIDLTLQLRALTLFGQHRVDVVHTHNPIPLIYTAAAGRALGAAVIHTKHGEGHMGSRGEKLLRRLSAPMAQEFVAVSEKTAEQARIQRDCPLDRLSVITNGIDLDRYRPDDSVRREVRQSLGIPDDAFVVGTVGRIDHNKNQVALVRAMAPLFQNQSPHGAAYHLVIAGDGPDMAELKRQAAAVGPGDDASGRIHLLGRRRDAPRLYCAFDIFALPSLSEGLPLVIPEAMASGLPVVSTAVGGIPDVVIEDETGHLIAPDDDEAMRTRIEALAQDRERTTTLGRSGRARALSEYSATRMNQLYMNLYWKALAERGRTAQAAARLVRRMN